MNSPSLQVNTDGGARGNPGPAAIGVVINGLGRQGLVKFGRVIGKATNNHAEYRAVIEALAWLVSHKQAIAKLKIANCNFFLDSTLVVNQLNGIFKVKDTNLRSQLIQVRQLEGVLGLPVTYRAVPRDQNQAADLLVNQALDVTA